MAVDEGNLGADQDQMGTTAKSAAASTANALDLIIDLLGDVQNVISGGRPRLVKLRLGDRVIAEIPVALTAAAAVAAGLVAVLLTKLAVEVEHED